MKQSIRVLFVGLFFLASLNQSFAGLNDESLMRSKVRWAPEVVTYIGELRTKEGGDDWEFVRESDGKVFDLEKSPALASVIYEKENAHLKIKIEAEKIGEDMGVLEKHISNSFNSVGNIKNKYQKFLGTIESAKSIGGDKEAEKLEDKQAGLLE